jgi:alcohol dehydrogenase class IV
MPNHVAAAVMFDALCHNMEAYLSRTTQPLVEMQAVYAMELLASSMQRALKDHTDIEAWSRVTLASTLGGMCINMAGVTAPHGLEHPASGLRNIVHGRGLAALSPVIYRETVVYAPDKCGDISRILGGVGPSDFVDQLNYLLEQIGLKTTLSNEGVEEKDIKWMVDNCMKVSAPAISAHPKVFTKEEIRDLYYKAL